jgi:hypothetical protein
VGFTKPSRSPGTLVVSYTTVSPLPRVLPRVAVCSLWHWPAGHPEWALPTTLSYGARTFLGSRMTGESHTEHATVRPTHPRPSLALPGSIPGLGAGQSAGCRTQRPVPRFSEAYCRIPNRSVPRQDSRWNTWHTC